MANYGTTAKYALRKLLGNSAANEIDDGIGALADDIDSKLAPSDQGLLSARPTSSVGTPGKSGRTYFATDTGQLFRDNGTGWTEITTRRVLYGRVTSAGAIGDAGSGGWSVTKTGTGVYAITFTAPFAAVPAVVATVAGGVNPVIGVDVPTGNGVTVRIRLNDTANDAGFTFQAIGV